MISFSMHLFCLLVAAFTTSCITAIIRLRRPSDVLAETIRFGTWIVVGMLLFGLVVVILEQSFIF